MTNAEQILDFKLIASIASGDTSAMTTFYQKHENRVYRFAMAKLNDTFAAADVLNDVMLEVWKAAKKFEGRSKVTTWLLGIANHKILDIWRKKGRVEQTELDENLPDEDTTPELAAAGASDAKVLKACMAKLKEEHREVLHLVFFEELNYAEITDILAVPEGTVKSRVYHAKNLLKKHLAHAMRSQSHE